MTSLRQRTHACRVKSRPVLRIALTPKYLWRRWTQTTSACCPCKLYSVACMAAHVPECMHACMSATPEVSSVTTAWRCSFRGCCVFCLGLSWYGLISPALHSVLGCTFCCFLGVAGLNLSCPCNTAATTLQRPRYVRTQEHAVLILLRLYSL